MVYRISYDNGAAFDAMPYSALAAALAEIRRAIAGGVHQSATITCISGIGPDTVMPWSQVQPLL